jgi:hypothetical protein
MMTSIIGIFAAAKIAAAPALAPYKADHSSM